MLLRPLLRALWTTTSRRALGRGRPMSFRADLLVEFLRYGVHRAVGSRDPLSIRRQERPTPLGARIRRRVRLQARDVGGVRALEITPESWSGRGTLLYLHGGGYCCCSSGTHRALVARLALATGVRALALDYRLAPEHPFPAPIEDVMAAHGALLSEGLPGGEVTLAGDSAGGGLAIASMVRMREEGRELPARAAVFSPWVDLSLSTPSIDRNEGTDFLSRGVLEFFSTSYLGREDPKSPLASPLYADLAGLPPLLVVTGELEILADEGRALAGRAEAAGVETTFREWKKCFHIFPSCAPILPEASAAIAETAEFLAGRKGSKIG